MHLVSPCFTGPRAHRIKAADRFTALVRAGPSHVSSDDLSSHPNRHGFRYSYASSRFASSSFVIRSRSASPVKRSEERRVGNEGRPSSQSQTAEQQLATFTVSDRGRPNPQAMISAESAHRT